MNNPSDTNGSNPLKVRRGRVASVDLYEIKDSELDLLENGSPATVQLNFAVFLLSIAFTSIAALCTATFKWDITQTVFVFVAIIGILMGTYLLLCWKKSRSSITGVIRAIRERIEMSEPKQTASTPPEPPGVASPENEPVG